MFAYSGLKEQRDYALPDRFLQLDLTNELTDKLVTFFGGHPDPSWNGHSTSSEKKVFSRQHSCTKDWSAPRKDLINDFAFN